MAKLSKAHVAFLLKNALQGLILEKNRFLALLANENHHFTVHSVDRLDFEFSQDLTSFSITATTALSSFDTEGNNDAVQRTIDVFKKHNWTKLLPEMLSSAYKLDVHSMPTEQNVKVEYQNINNRNVYTHSIVFKARNYIAVERTVNGYHKAFVNTPSYFRSVEVQGFRNETLKVDHNLYLSRGYTFTWSNDNNVVNTEPYNPMLFKHRFLDFSANVRSAVTGIFYKKNVINEEVIIPLNVLTAIEAVVEIDNRTKHILATINNPIVDSDSRIFYDKLDFTELLTEHATKADIKRFLLVKAVKGAKVTLLKTHGLKRNVALSNNAKYKAITFIGSLWGHDVIIHTTKSGKVTVTDLLGVDINRANFVERVDELMTNNLTDLFANDREYACSILCKQLSYEDAMDAVILFS